MLARLLVIMLALAWQARAVDLSVKVVGISDGDTVRVRLSGIDAPEFGQAFGTKSNEALAGKVFSKKVTLVTHGQDDYGRTIGTLQFEKRNINQEMVAEGWYCTYCQAQIPIRSRAGSTGDRIVRSSR